MKSNPITPWISRSLFTIASTATIATFVNCGGTADKGTSAQQRSQSPPRTQPQRPSHALAEAPASNEDPTKLAGPNEVLNPISLKIGADEVLDSPDPNVYAHDGKYYLTYTPETGNIPIFESDDLKSWHFLKYAFAENDVRMVGDALHIGSHYYCHIWAPELHDDDFGGVQLSFTAVRLSTLTEGHCPGYNQDSGIYVASSPDGMKGHFAVQSRTPDEPKPFARPATCAQRPTAPRSPASAFNSCDGGPCDAIMRLDQTIFKDGGKTWLGYSWYTNSRPVNAWEQANNGEHLSVTELDPANDYALPCESANERLLLVNPHDESLHDALKSSCVFCDQFLSFTTDRLGRPYYPNGYLQGVAEGASFFRRGDWVYLLASGGVWDSATYNVFWVAAHSVEELAAGNARRLVGRYLVPDGHYSFGHGSVVQAGTDKFYYVYHRLDHWACVRDGDCRRRLMISPIEFENHGDANQDAYIAARQPMESDAVVHLPLSRQANSF